MSNKFIFGEGFNLLCGKLLGEGIHRKVFECRIREDLVVKVEEAEWPYFANVHEMRVWCDNQHAPKISKWLAPCEYMSPNGRIMLQKKVRSISSTDKLPDKLPSFLTDIKRENFGFIGDNLVCVDYAFLLTKPNLNPRKVDWGKTF